MVASRGATPLWISPLVHHRKEDPKTEQYKVLQRLVTQSPNPHHSDSEIETALEAFVVNGESLWRRVVVRSGPTCPKQIIHASFTLPNDGPTVPVLVDSADSSSLCWASFPERPDHKLLCVLSSPTLLCIWDVYPGGKEYDLGGEGHFIPLPFEACAVHAIGDKHGLLLQRTDSMEDRIAFDLHNKTWTMMGFNDHEEDDGFFLKAPPRPVRLGGDINMSGSSIGGMNIPTASNPVPSLFSLSHPLDDVLPISLQSDSEAPTGTGTVTDVFEKILFVGVLRWTDQNDALLDRREYSQPICVTYHTQRKR
jgi:hypothetical protein